MNPEFEPGDRVKVKDTLRNRDWVRRYGMQGTLIVSHFDGICYYFSNNDWKALPDRLEYANEEVPW